MKKILSTISTLLIFSSLLHSQYGDLLFSDTVDFETNHNWIIQDTTNIDNVWEIGIPSKPYFDSAYSSSNAIVTDLINPYPSNNNSYFDIIIMEEEIGDWWMYGEGSH